MKKLICNLKGHIWPRVSIYKPAYDTQYNKTRMVTTLVCNRCGVEKTEII